jgi:phenylpropionate dioxygenase-like ring-hydroxylating dioxygenase large terminal subunit
MSAVDTVDRALQAADLKGAIDRGLPGQWWALCAADWLKDKPLALTRLGVKLVLWRDAQGRPHAIEDRCPHRGAPLSLGQIHEGMISCWYHGLTLDGHGTIRSVPALPGCSLEGKKAVAAYPVVEKANCLFAYFPTAASPEPVPFDLPEEFDSPDWSHFLCTSRWQGNYQLALDNLVDPMHGSYLHAKSYTLAYGAKSDRMKVERTATGFVVSREGQHGVNFDWTEYCFTGADWVRLDLPYPKGAGPGGMFRILGFVTPIDERACQVFFWRLRKVSGWQRDLWRFMYRNRLEERHWNVLEQDRIVIEGIAPGVTEMLYQHDIGVSYLRRLLATRAKRLAEAEAAKAGRG